MRKSILCLAALAVVLILVDSGAAQPPGRRPGGRRGRDRGPAPAPTLDQTVAALKLSDKNKETATAAVKSYKENVRKLNELAQASLLLKVKSVLTPEDFKKVKDALAREPRTTNRLARGRGRGRGTATDIVARIMSFDKNKDGKVTKDELPERMHDLLAKGDTNKDGALDLEEIKKLARTPPPNLDQTVTALKLSDKNKETAAAAVKSYKENCRKLNELAGEDLLLKMGEILAKEDLGKVKTALDRPAGAGRPAGVGGRFGFGRRRGS